MSENKQTDTARRDFLKQGPAIAAGLALAPGVLLYGVAEAKPADQAVTSKVRWGMLVDTNKCSSGCSACVDACVKYNGLDNYVHSAPTQRTQYIRKVDLRNLATGKKSSLPMMCQHCEEPPCADVCPTGASFRRADGIVLVDRHICIGCRYCMMACPYKARSFVHENLENQRPWDPRGKGTVEACNMCVDRVDGGKEPACVVACKEKAEGAIVFGDLKDPKSEISQRLAQYQSTAIRADLGLNPGVRYEGI